MDNWASILPLILLVIAFVFLVVRPARARQREFQKLQGTLQAGQKIMIVSGIYGEIVTIGDDTIDLRVAQDTVVTVARNAVARVVLDEPDAPDDATGDDH